MNVKKARYFLGIKGICRAINRERCYVSLRMNGHKEFTPREIELIESEIERAKGESA